MRRLLPASLALSATAAGLGALAAFSGRWGVVAVAGNSMRPTLQPGDACLVRYGAPIRPGDVVVAQLPARPLGIKRAALHDGDGWWLTSDDPAQGTDSATFGSVGDADVLGRVLLRYWPEPAWLGTSPAAKRS